MIRKGIGLGVFCLTVIAFLALAYAPAESATITVDASALDVLDGNNSSCALREAIRNINDAATTYADCPATGGYGTNDTINLLAGTYTNTISGSGEDANASGDLDILKSLTITGAGAASTIIDGGAIDRVFHIPGATTVNISGVTIRNGYVAGAGSGILNNGTLTLTNSTISGNSTSGDNGGGIFNSIGATLTVTNSIIGGNTSNSGAGGGIFNNGTLTVTNSTISGNSASNSHAGGIFNTGTLTVTNSTISDNSSTAGGGGIFSNPGGTLTVTNSTISDNSASGGWGGGGIYSGGIDTVTNSTISGNFAPGGGGGIFNTVGTLTVTNSTITDNSAPTGGGISNNSAVNLKNTIVANQAVGGDCNVAVTSTLNDLDSDGSCGVGSLSNQNPLLGALANNGGPTQTHALPTGSPAIDAGDATTCAATPVNGVDQRGVIRPQGPGCDIGAFELEQAATSVPTMTGWGMLIFMVLAGLGGFFYLRREQA